MAKKKIKGAIPPSQIIAQNRKSRFNYALEDRFEAGIVLQGWEVKSLRAGKANISEAYVILKRGEIWIVGAQINPLLSASTHVRADATASRKLLLHRYEIRKLVGYVQRSGYTLIPTVLYWKKGRVKVEFALAKGKKAHDKRQTIKEREWNREKSRVLKPR